MRETIPLCEKFALTISEAVQYFGIGEKKLRNLVNSHPDGGFWLYNGNKVLIKRGRFEKFLEETTSL